jgi:hypothetical protein
VSLYCRYENTKSEKVFFPPEKRPEEQGRAANDENNVKWKQLSEVDKSKR